MLGLGLGINRDTMSKTWLEKLNAVSAFLDTAETKYAKSRNLWIQIIRDSDGTTMDVGYDAASRAAAFAWSTGTSSYKCKRYNQISGKADITISSSSDQELIITGGAWVNNTAKYCLFEPSKSTLSVMDIPLSVNGRMKNKSLAAYIIQKDDKSAITDYTSDYVYPIKCSSGLMDFSITNGSDVFYYLFGGTTSTSSHPAPVLNAGVSYMFATNMIAGNISLSSGNTNDNYIGNTADTPAATYILRIANTKLYGDITYLPKYIYNLEVWPHATGRANLTGDLSSLGIIINLLDLGVATNIIGIFKCQPTTKYIYINNTSMTPDDTDLTLIYIANITTTIGSIRIRNNRTYLSDSAVTMLLDRGWTIVTSG